MQHADIAQRLRALATRLLDAYEAIELPTSFVEADRAAKALISIGKAIALTGDEAPAPAPKPVAPPVAAPRKTAGVSPYLEVERQARALRGGELSDEEIDALLGPP